MKVQHNHPTTVPESRQAEMQDEIVLNVENLVKAGFLHVEADVITDGNVRIRMIAPEGTPLFNDATLDALSSNLGINVDQACEQALRAFNRGIVVALLTK